MQGTTKYNAARMVKSPAQTYEHYQYLIFQPKAGEVLPKTFVGIPLTLPGLTPLVMAKSAA